MQHTPELLAQAIAKLADVQRDQCIDGLEPSSRPTEKQNEVFRDAPHVSARFVIAGNQSGKSSIGARETAWVFNRNHPYWDVNKQYGDKPLLILVVGRVGEQVESELYRRKIKPLLKEGTYKEVRTGNALQRLEHKENGNVIIFMSHHDINSAREKIQSYTAAYAWLDEAVSSASFLSELLLRVQASRGKLLATFTPLVRSQEVKDMIEGFEEPTGKRYKFGMLDNPLYKDQEEEIKKRFKDLNEDERNARLYGDWFKGGQNLYDFSSEDMHEPEGYHPNWAHLEVIDPAVSGLTGFMLLACHPRTHTWYVVKAEYIKGSAPTELIKEVEKLTAGYNIIRRTCDPHETWFITQAALQRRYYGTVYRKNDRKSDLIKGAQQALADKRVVVTPWCPDLAKELESCMVSETTGKIIAASRFHLLDCLQYGVDTLPPQTAPSEPLSFERQLREANKKRIANETKRQNKLRRRKSRW